MFDAYFDTVATALRPAAPHAAAENWLLRALTQARDAIARDGRSAGYARTLAGLPEVAIAHRALTATVAAVPVEALPPADAAALAGRLAGLNPWRKGPFSLAGVAIDAEWRSDWKWARVMPHLRPLAGRRVLDVGCGNGYYTWRMLGAGAALVVGLDPAVLALAQFLAVRRYLGPMANHLLSVPGEALDQPLAWFDTVFSMGVLYHRRAPGRHLAELRRALGVDGELVLETLVIDAAGLDVLVPPGRYAQMRNVHAVPSCRAVERWLLDADFTDIRCVDRAATTTAEQRSTAWMSGPSLAAFLDPADSTRTIEGHPAPMRAVFIARAR